MKHSERFEGMDLQLLEPPKSLSVLQRVSIGGNALIYIYTHSISLYILFQEYTLKRVKNTISYIAYSNSFSFVTQ